MSICMPVEKPQRQASDYPQLAPGGAALRLPSWNKTLDRAQVGRMAGGGCLYGGQINAFWAPLRDLLHITNGPVGCGVYVHADRAVSGGAVGVDSFSGLNLSTDFQERDVVFGGDSKLARAIAEAHALFPLHNGVSLLSTCPVALIGDDIDTVAKSQAKAIGKPVIPVHCAGFRRGDGEGETYATIAETWRDWAEPSTQPGYRDVTLLCREMSGAWRAIVRLLEEIGLRVTARWPAGGSRAETARLGKGRLCISVGMEHWAARLQKQYGTPWVDADFLGPRASCESLRTIAAHFDSALRQRAEEVIAAQAPAADALVAAARARIAGKLYFSFGPLNAREIRTYAEYGIRVGSALQGWQDEQGRWQLAEVHRHYQEMTPQQAEDLLQRVKPDLVGGLGDDSAALRKRGYAILDDSGRAALARAAIGFAGTARLTNEFLQLFDTPVRRLIGAPWRQG